MVDLDTFLGSLGVILYGDRFFPADVGVVDSFAWEAGLNVVRRFASDERRVVPYAGLGLSYSRYKASTSLLGGEISGEEGLGGVNILAGISYEGLGVVPFAETRYVASDAGQFVIAAGVQARLGR